MARLRDAIMWIALNDEPTCADPEVMEPVVSVLLVADLWNKTPREIAERVIGARIAEGLIEVDISTGWFGEWLAKFEDTDKRSRARTRGNDARRATLASAAAVSLGRCARCYRRPCVCHPGGAL